MSIYIAHRRRKTSNALLRWIILIPSFGSGVYLHTYCVALLTRGEILFSVASVCEFVMMFVTL